MLEAYVISSFIIVFSSLFVGIFVYRRDRANIVNFMYFLISVSIAVWSFGFMTLISAPSKIMAIWGARVCNIRAILIPVFFLHFILALLSVDKLKKRILYLAYAFNF